MRRIGDLSCPALGRVLSGVGEVSFLTLGPPLIADAAGPTRAGLCVDGNIF